MLAHHFHTQVVRMAAAQQVVMHMAVQQQQVVHMHMHAHVHVRVMRVSMSVKGTLSNVCLVLRLQVHLYHMQGML